MSKYENLRAESLSLLESNILPFWATRMVDNERGGFYGRIDGHNILTTSSTASPEESIGQSMRMVHPLTPGNRLSLSLMLSTASPSMCG